MESRYVSLRFRAPIDSEEALHGFMLMQTTIEGIEEAADGSTLFYIPKEEWDAEMTDRVTAFIATLEGVEFLGSAEMEERDYNADWEASIEPQQPTPDLVITPSWKLHEAQALGAQYQIVIDPKMSFGTGHHETTRLVLQSMEHLELEGRTLLDVGTGSGVLAIYALLRGGSKAVVIDTDPWSIENVQENRDLNAILPESFDIRQGTLQETVRKDEQFDVILANIHRNVLLEIAHEIRIRCNAGANVILSGLLIYDVEEVRPKYEAEGFRLLRDVRENEWAALTFALPT